MSKPLAVDLFEEAVAADSDSASSALATPATRRVLEAATRAGVPYALKILPTKPETLEDIASACDCPTDYIVRPTIFKAKTSKKPILVLASGKSKLNDKAMSALVGEVLEKGSADYVLKQSGFELGAVPPYGLATRMLVMIDDHLLRFARVWCPAGTPDSFILVPTLVLARSVSARIVKLD